MKLFYYLFVAGALMISACNTDMLPEPTPPVCDMIEITYDDGMRELIDQACAYSGCHTVSFPQGDFSTYDGLFSRLDNGKFKEEVIDQRTMPPEYSPAGRPKELTEEEMALIECWIENNYPEN